MKNQIVLTIIAIAMSIICLQGQYAEVMVYNTCPEGETGSVTITLDPTVFDEGYDLPFEGAWDNDANGNAEDFIMTSLVHTIENLPADDYELTIFLSDDCTLTTTFNIGELDVTVTSSISDTHCDGSGAGLTLSVWSDGVAVDPSSVSVIWADDDQVLGLVRTDLGPGYYCAMIDMGGGCVIESCHEIDGFFLEEVIQQASCGEGGGGSISLIPSAQLSSEGTISWLLNGEAAPQWAGNLELASLVPGEYCYDFINASCERSNCINIEARITDDQIVLEQANDGFAPNFRYNARVRLLDPTIGQVTVGWYDEDNNLITTTSGQQPHILLDLEVGDRYCVVVTTLGGCIYSDCITIEGNSCQGLIDVQLVELGFPSTADATDGHIEIELITNHNQAAICLVDGGYTIDWDHGGSGLIQNNLPPGTYCVTVDISSSNMCNCTINTCFELPAMNPDCDAISPGSYKETKPESCSSTNGAIYFIQFPSSTNGPVEFIWTDQEGHMIDAASSTDPSISGLPPGIYTLMVFDNAGCSDAFVFDLTTDDLDVEVTILPSCVGAANGSISLDIFASGGGSQTFILDWDTEPQQTIDEIGTLDNLEAGNYCVNISQVGGGCMIRRCFEVEEAGSGTLGIELVANSYCSQTQFGILNVNVVGGLEPLDIQWTLDGLDIIRSSHVINSPGTYCIQVLDQCGSSASQCYSVLDNSITYTLSGQCMSDARIDIFQNDIPYFVFVNGESFGSFDGNRVIITSNDLDLGENEVKVISETNCQNIQTIIVEPLIHITANIIPGREGLGAIEIDLSGPVGDNPFFNWSNGAQTQNLEGLYSGVYTVEVIGEHGCKGKETFILDNLDCELLEFSVDILDDDMVDCQSGEFRFEVHIDAVMSGFPPYFIVVEGYGYDEASGTRTQIAYSESTTSETIISYIGRAGDYTVSINDQCNWPTPIEERFSLCESCGYEYDAEKEEYSLFGGKLKLEVSCPCGCGFLGGSEKIKLIVGDKEEFEPGFFYIVIWPQPSNPFEDRALAAIFRSPTTDELLMLGPSLIYEDAILEFVPSNDDLRQNRTFVVEVYKYVAVNGRPGDLICDLFIPISFSNERNDPTSIFFGCGAEDNERSSINFFPQNYYVGSIPCGGCDPSNTLGVYTNDPTIECVTDEKFTYFTFAPKEESDPCNGGGVLTAWTNEFGEGVDIRTITIVPNSALQAWENQSNIASTNEIHCKDGGGCLFSTAALFGVNFPKNIFASYCFSSTDIPDDCDGDGDPDITDPCDCDVFNDCVGCQDPFDIDCDGILNDLDECPENPDPDCGDPDLDGIFGDDDLCPNYHSEDNCCDEDDDGCCIWEDPNPGVYDNECDPNCQIDLDGDGLCDENGEDPCPFDEYNLCNQCAGTTDIVNCELMITCGDGIIETIYGTIREEGYAGVGDEGCKYCFKVVVCLIEDPDEGPLRYTISGPTSVLDLGDWGERCEETTQVDGEGCWHDAECPLDGLRYVFNENGYCDPDCNISNDACTNLEAYYPN